MMTTEFRVQLQHDVRNRHWHLQTPLPPASQVCNQFDTALHLRDDVLQQEASKHALQTVNLRTCMYSHSNEIEELRLRLENVRQPTQASGRSGKHRYGKQRSDARRRAETRVLYQVQYLQYNVN